MLKNQRLWLSIFQPFQNLSAIFGHYPKRTVFRPNRSAAGVSRGRNGFRKDKGGEKLAESEEDLLQHRTDGTDAFDTLYIGCEKFPFKELMPYTASGLL